MNEFENDSRSEGETVSRTGQSCSIGCEEGQQTEIDLGMLLALSEHRS